MEILDAWAKQVHSRPRGYPDQIAAKNILREGNVHRAGTARGTVRPPATGTRRSKAKERAKAKAKAKALSKDRGRGGRQQVVSI